MISEIPDDEFDTLLYEEHVLSLLETGKVFYVPTMPSNALLPAYGYVLVKDRDSVSVMKQHLRNGGGLDGI